MSGGISSDYYNSGSNSCTCSDPCLQCSYEEQGEAESDAGLSNVFHLETSILLFTVFHKDMCIACLAIILIILKTPLPILDLIHFPGGTSGKESACNAGDLGSIPDREDPLEKKMATHSSLPAWRIPGTEEPGGLQSRGSQRVRHD